MSTLPILLILFILSVPSLADILTSTHITPSTACKSTLHPEVCKSILPPSGHQNMRSYAKFSLTKSLSHAKKLTRIINRYLTHQSDLSAAAVQALEDCSLLADLNIDYLNSARDTLNSTTTLLDRQTATIHTLLSALLTNLHTCNEGVQAASSSWFLNSGFAEPFSNGTKLYSVALSLFHHAWVLPKMKTPRNNFVRSNTPHFHEMNVGSKGSDLPLRTSRPNRKLFEQRSGRKLFQSPNTVVVSEIVVVSRDGTGNFTTIGDAVAAAPKNADDSSGYFLIYVSAGVYEEYVTIPKSKKHVMMIGDGINRTVITGNHNKADVGTTFKSATFAVVGEGFVGINMTIQNTAGAAKHQAVALRNGADLSSFYLCSIEGYQDTLYAHSMRQFYRECDIYGTIDYIFGNAAVVFQNCSIYSRLPLSNQENTITAQGRSDPYQNTGISIQSCSLLAARELIADNGMTGTLTYLGRPWKNYSRTVIMKSFMDSVIDPAGWLAWDGDFALNTLYYAEYKNTGPGADTSNRVTWAGCHNAINSTAAAEFTVSSFIFGDVWLPFTGVPYYSELI